MTRHTFRFLGGRIIDAFSIIDHLTSRKKVRIPDRIIRVANFDSDTGADFVVLAALSPDLSKLIHAQNLVRQLSLEGYRVLVLTRLKGNVFPQAEMTFHWNHLGRDYFAFKCVWLNTLAFIRTSERILFLNDSILWAAGAPSRLLQLHETADYVLLPTESSQIRKHAQPYFFLIPNNFQNELIDRILSPARNWKFKRSAVRWGEFRFLKNLKFNKINYTFLLDHEKFHAATKTNCNFSNFLGCRDNPTIAASDYLWNEYGFKKN